MANLQLIGIEQLGDSEKEILGRLLKEYQPKIEKKLKGIETIILHIKSQSKGGRAKHYKIILRIISPSVKLESTAEEWDFSLALHKSFEEILKEIGRKTRAD